jgi:hypothetical protein
MTIEIMRKILAWCAVMNIALLVWWFIFIAFAHDWAFKLHSKWFNISRETFDAIHYAGMAFFKLGTLLFILIPYFALHIVG